MPPSFNITIFLFVYHDFRFLVDQRTSSFFFDYFFPLFFYGVKWPIREMCHHAWKSAIFIQNFLLFRFEVCFLNLQRRNHWIWKNWEMSKNIKNLIFQILKKIILLFCCFIFFAFPNILVRWGHQTFYVEGTCCESKRKSHVD